MERDLCAIRQAIQAGLLDGRNMDENVLAARIWRDKAVTLRRVEPLHSTARHVALPRNYDCRRLNLMLRIKTAGLGRTWSVGDQLVSVNSDFSVARCAGEAIVSACPSDGFGCCLTASRTGNFDALIVEEMFGHYSTTDHGLLACDAVYV